MVVTLVGYRGTGKSTIAPLLARRLGWSAVDADREIEAVAGCTIREIFEERGEPAFRQYERDVMARLLGQRRVVIAAGGGAVLDPQTRARMRAAGPVVWLQAPVDVIRKRLSRDAATAEQRPRLSAASTTDEIEEILAKRTPLYEEVATLCVETAGRTEEEIAEAIVAALPVEVHEGGAE